MVRNEPRHSWTIASSVAVIIFGSYLVYNSRNSNPATIIIKPAAIVGGSRLAVEEFDRLLRPTESATVASRAVVMQNRAKDHRVFARKNAAHATAIAALVLLVLGVVLERPGEESVIW